MKSHTDLEQSKKLTEILPLETADCFWDYDDLQKYHRISWFEEGYNKDSQLRPNENNICAWSLAALLGYLKRRNRFPEIIELSDGRFKLSTYVWDGEYGIQDSIRNTIVDACFELILKLHKLELL